MFISVSDAAKALKMRPSTIRRKIKQGLIPACRLGGSTSPVRIDIDELKRVVSGTRGVARDMEIFSEYNRNPSEQMRYDELNNRCMRLAETIGPERVVALLKEFGVERLACLHPQHYASFRGKLLRLSRGLLKEKAA